MNAAVARPTTARVAPLARYGLLGMPLAFAALPGYVHWPALATARWGLPLAGLGALLLAVRVVDAAVDPLVGRLADRGLARGAVPTLAAMALGGALMLVGLGVLFVHQPAAPGVASAQSLQLPHPAPAVWALAAAALTTTSLGYSLVQIAHQAWGARLASSSAPASSWIAAREAAALAGVLAASALPSMFGWPSTLAVLAILFAAGLAALHRVPTPVDPPAQDAVRADRRLLQLDAAFRRLLAVHGLNGIASAVPATVMAFYVADVLDATAHVPWLLSAYFIAAGASTPWWAAVVRRVGLGVAGAWRWCSALPRSQAPCCSALATSARSTSSAS